MKQLSALIIALSLSVFSLIANESETCPAQTYEDEVANCCYPPQHYIFPNDYDDYPPPPCLCYKPCYSYYYVGFDGGWMLRLKHVPPHSRVGAGNLGTAFDAKAEPGYTVGASIGYRWNCLLRTDISYTFLHPKSHNWKTRFPLDVTESFKAYLHSHLVLFNTYFHPNEFLCLFSSLDPYITCGVGVAINQLDHIKEFTPSGIFYSEIQSYTQTQFAGRLGVGVMKYFCRCWIMDVGFNANYIKSIRSGNERETFNVPGVSTAGHEKIGVFRFKNNWIGNFYLGLKYAF